MSRRCSRRVWTSMRQFSMSLMYIKDLDIERWRAGRRVK